MNFSVVEIIPFLLYTGIFPIPLIVAFIVFFKKKKREKLIFNKELKKFLWVNYSLEGRVKREDYWYYGYGVYWTIITIIYIPFIFISKLVHGVGIFDDFHIGYLFFLTSGGILMIIIFLSWCMKFLGNKIKRLHDNNKSGWFLLWTLIPILGQFFALYIFITNWFLRGTIGTNDFGADPVEKDIMPVITIKDVAKTFGLLLIIITIFAVYGVVVGLLTGGI